MTTSRITRTGTLLALALLVPVDCRQAVPQKESPTPERNVNSTEAPRASQVTEVDRNTPAEKSPDPANSRTPPRREWEIDLQAHVERTQRDTRDTAKAAWQIAIRTDTPTIVPCQPVYVTSKVTNVTNQARKLNELLHKSEICVLVARQGEQPSLVDQSSAEGVIVCFDAADEQEKVIPGKGSVYFQRILTIEQIDEGALLNADGSWSPKPDAKRIFGEPGQYNVYAAVVDRFSTPRDFEVVRSNRLALTVREPTESEAPFVEFFRDGRQIPPHYGFSKVDEVAFDKLRGRGQPTVTLDFQRKADAGTIDRLRKLLAKYPDPPVADDIRQYLMTVLIRSARQHDDRGRTQGYDRDVLAAAAQQYLDIAPERKQLRRRGINTWGDLSTRFDLDHSQPILQILASWKAASPFYEDEVESQAALDQIIDKIETRYAQHAAKKAAAPPPKPKLPTD